MYSLEINNLKEQLDRVEQLLIKLVAQHTQKEYYSTSDIARILKRSEFTVREWCRLRRVWAEKRKSGRGNTFEWKIAHNELLRIQNEGLLPNKGKSFE